MRIKILYHLLLLVMLLTACAPSKSVSYSLGGIMVLGEPGESEFRFTFVDDKLKVVAQQFVFAGEPMVVEGSR